MPSLSRLARWMQRLSPVLLVLVALAPLAVLRTAAAQGLSSDVVTVSVLPGRTVVRPGEVVPIGVVLDHTGKWHTQAARTADTKVEEDAIPTEVRVTTSDGRAIVRSDAIQWPTAKRLSTQALGAPIEMDVYADRATVFVPIEFTPTATSGNVEFLVTLTYQACDDRSCLAPVTSEHSVIMAVDPPPVVGGGGYRTREAAEPPPAEPLLYPDIFSGWSAVPASLPPVIATGAAGGTRLLVILIGVVVAIAVIGVVVVGILRKA